MRKIFFFLFLSFILASCVPNKNLIYLKGQPVNSKQIRKISNEAYKLQVNDIISIDIKSSDPELVKFFTKDNNQNEGGSSQNQGGYFSGYTIDRHGNIRLPVLGEINVLGYTTKEVRIKIEDKLLQDSFKSKDDFFVTVKLDGIRYTVMGEVGSPGPKVIYQNQVSIIDAITNAGDITLTGNRKNVEVIRSTPTEVKKYQIDLTNIEAVNSELFYIKPRDIINVMPLKQKSWGTGTTGLQSLTTIVSVFTLVTSTILIVRGL